MKHKYIILVGDGMADFPVAEIGGRTPLEHALTPNMDRVAALGRAGLLATIPDGYLPGSDIGNMSLLGYDPTKYFSGRAPIEAASMGVALADDDVAFRCNLVTIENDVMRDYSAGHISTENAKNIICELQKKLGNDVMTFHSGVSYRHLLTIKNIGAKLECVPPHDIIGQSVDTYLPKCADDKNARSSNCDDDKNAHINKCNDDRDFILSVMKKARAVIAELKSSNKDNSQATDIWLWGQGPSIILPSLHERYGLTGSVISAVDLVRGLGKLAGLTIRIVEGATGYLGTNYAGKVAAAISAFERGEDFVYLHVEAPDETSHEGDLNKKIQAIEEFDKHVVGEILKYQSQNKNLRIAVSPDHVTALSTRTHDASPVPFCMCGDGVEVDDVVTYCEKSSLKYEPINGVEFFDMLVR